MKQKKKEETKEITKEKKSQAKKKDKDLGIVVDANLPRTSKSPPRKQERTSGRGGGSISQTSMNPITQKTKKTKKVQEDSGHEWLTYVREPASPGAPAREIKEEVYAEPEVRNLDPLMNLTVSPTKEFEKTAYSMVGPRSGLLYTGWSKPFRIERVDD